MQTYSRRVGNTPRILVLLSHFGEVLPMLKYCVMTSNMLVVEEHYAVLTSAG